MSRVYIESPVVAKGRKAWSRDTDRDHEPRSPPNSHNCCYICPVKRVASKLLPHWAVPTGFAVLVVASCVLAACGATVGTGDCGNCAPSQHCVDGTCVDHTGGAGGTGHHGGNGGTTSLSFSNGSGGCPNAQLCGSECCTSDEICALQTLCAPQQDACADNDDCWFDSYCLGGECIPYEIPPEHDHDDTCENTIDINAILPDVQCRWTGPPMGDSRPLHVHVMSTPVVVDFNFDNDPKTLTPSIVFTTFPTAGSYSNPGVLRIIDGNTCAQQHSLDDPTHVTMSPASVALGDINGDGRSEIVAAAHGGGLIAFVYNNQTKTFEKLWRSGACNGGQGPPINADTTGGNDKWSGPSIHDLDDDGKPEIIYGAVVYQNDGCIISNSLGFQAYHKGQIPVIADVDEDGQMELVVGNAIFGWDSQNSTWVSESYFTASGGNGFVAVADMGNFPIAALGNKDFVEIIVIQQGTARVQTIDGAIVFGPIPLTGTGNGGPPTVADFDGDGRNEFASAGGSNYVVFDFDCLVNGNPANCGGMSKTSGILWTQPSKDQSSNVTGSSVFDFDGDGSAEAIYADECFLRIYEGATGKVLYSAARSSGTTYENPVIADVDGDYRTEIVSAVNDYAGSLGCPNTDPLLPTSIYEQNHGIVVLRDEQDRWAASRPVWNQHAYAVTHVGDAGEIPKTSQVKLNWKEPGLNNFRQNVQGSLAALGVPDLTAGGTVGAVQCEGNIATIEARVCNRGTLPMVGGTKVSFYNGALDGPELCNAPIPVALQVAECDIVSCKTNLGDLEIDVYVLVDPDGETKECWEKNNVAVYYDVACGQVPK